jgi:triosephosphate isomerase
MRQRIVTGNWKMNLTWPQAQDLGRELRNRVRPSVDGQVSICPPYPYLAPLARLLAESAVEVGGQDIDSEDSGARTGAVSGAILKSVGCSFTLVGHSERRHVFHDTNDVVAAKLQAGLRNDLDVTLCVGETQSERESGRTFQIVTEQLNVALNSLNAQEMSRVRIAYEPVWAIGTGLVATPEQAQEVHARIRGHLAELFSSIIADQTQIQYGGSVKPANSAELMSQTDIDGVLVGGASLESESFISIIRTRS